MTTGSSQPASEQPADRPAAPHQPDIFTVEADMPVPEASDLPGGGEPHAGGTAGST